MTDQEGKDSPKWYCPAHGLLTPDEVSGIHYCRLCDQVPIRSDAPWLVALLAVTRAECWDAGASDRNELVSAHDALDVRLAPRASPKGEVYSVWGRLDALLRERDRGGAVTAAAVVLADHYIDYDVPFGVWTARMTLDKLAYRAAKAAAGKETPKPCATCGGSGTTCYGESHGVLAPATKPCPDCRKVGGS